MSHRIKKMTLKNQALNRIHPAHWHRGRIQRLHLYSRQLGGQERAVDVYLPPGYDQDQQRRYPVLYMHDGNNLFYPQLAFGQHPWHADQMLDRLINHGLIEPMILVGVHNSAGRDWEYTWTEMQSRRGRQGGGGHYYAHFLVDELKPRIDWDFRTLTGPEHTGTMGSSLGGLIAYYLGLYFPFVFSRIGMISPSFWWGRGHAFTELHKLSPELQLWLDMGTREGSRRGVEQMRQQLILRGYREGENLGFLIDRGGRHHEHWWGQRLHLPLMFLYGRKELIRVRA